MINLLNQQVTIFLLFTRLTMDNMLNLSYILLFLNRMFINSYFTIKQLIEKRIIIYFNEAVTGV